MGVERRMSQTEGAVGRRKQPYHRSHWPAASCVNAPGHRRASEPEVKTARPPLPLLFLWLTLAAAMAWSVALGAEGSSRVLDSPGHLRLEESKAPYVTADDRDSQSPFDLVAAFAAISS